MDDFKDQLQAMLLRNTSHVKEQSIAPVKSDEPQPSVRQKDLRLLTMQSMLIPAKSPAIIRVIFRVIYFGFFISVKNIRSIYWKYKRKSGVLNVFFRNRINTGFS